MLFKDEPQKGKLSIFSKARECIIAGLVITIAILSQFTGDFLKPKPQIVAVSAIGENSLGSFLTGKSTAEKEKVYKLFKGLSDFCVNADRTPKNSQLEKMVSEVILIYKLEGFAELEPIIQSKIVEAGLNKDMSLSKENRDKAAVVLNGLADQVKSSIEKDLSKVK